MDLIDMRWRPDGMLKWILHVKDHFSKFSWAYPLGSNEPELVAEKLLNQFYSFGVPCVLQSGNGKEFVARVIKVYFNRIFFIKSNKTCLFFVGNEKDLDRFSTFKWPSSTFPNTRLDRTW
jgi:hypothetical protein